MSHQFLEALDAEITRLTQALAHDPTRAIELEIAQAEKLLSVTKQAQFKRAINKQIERLEASRGAPRDEQDIRERLDLLRRVHLTIVKHPDYQPKKRRGRKPGPKPKIKSPF